jgi:integrase/recombinase XerD
MDTKKVFLSRYSGGTRKQYGRVLDEFEGATGVSLDKAGRKEVLEYFDLIKDGAAATVNRKIATLSSYFKYMVDLDVRIDIPTKVIRRPKSDPVRTIKWLNRAEVRRLLQAAEGDPRTLALVWMGLHGLRLSEIVGLSVEHLSDGAVRVHGKGNKTRYVALAEPARVAIYAYLAGRQSGPMFLGAQGRLKARRIEDIIGAVSEQAGRRIHPHVLRHTVGTEAIKNGYPTLVVQKLLGHRDPKTTERYVHLDTSDIQGMIDNTFTYLLEEPFSVVTGGKEKAV